MRKSLSQEMIVERSPIYDELDDQEINYGIEYVHELQNFYFDKLSGERLNLKNYIKNHIKEQINHRAAMDSRPNK